MGIGVCYGVWMGSWVPTVFMHVCLCGVLESERSSSPFVTLLLVRKKHRRWRF